MLSLPSRPVLCFLQTGAIAPHLCSPDHLEPTRCGDRRTNARPLHFPPLALPPHTAESHDSTLKLSNLCINTYLPAHPQCMSPCGVGRFYLSATFIHATHRLVWHTSLFLLPLTSTSTHGPASSLFLPTCEHMCLESMENSLGSIPNPFKFPMPCRLGTTGRLQGEMNVHTDCSSAGCMAAGWREYGKTTMGCRRCMVHGAHEEQHPQGYRMVRHEREREVGIGKQAGTQAGPGGRQGLERFLKNHTEEQRGWMNQALSPAIYTTVPGLARLAGPSSSTRGG